MAGPLFVPDASVILKWVLRSDDEPEVDMALQLKSAWLAEACELLVPGLWLYEVGNVVGLKQPDHAAEHLRKARSEGGVVHLSDWRMG